ncbi:MAG: serine hydrolase domain-containing protein [Pirellulaceae bacterium]
MRPTPKFVSWKFLILFVFGLQTFLLHAYSQIDLNEKLRQAVDSVPRTSIPAVFAAVQIGDLPPTIVVKGVRKNGDDVSVTELDQVHIGSCTKAFTALMIAQLVEQGTLRWEQTIAESFANDLDKIDPGFHSVTLESLCDINRVHRKTRRVGG